MLKGVGGIYVCPHRSLSVEIMQAFLEKLGLVYGSTLIFCHATDIDFIPMYVAAIMTVCCCGCSCNDK